MHQLTKQVKVPRHSRKHWSEKTEGSISLTYQQHQHVQTTEKPVRKLGEIPTNNKHRTVPADLHTTERKTMKTTDFKFQLAARWAVALSVFVGAGGAQTTWARSNASLTPTL